MRKITLFILLTLIIVSVRAEASQVLCPGKLVFVNLGDTIQTVIQTCGKPLHVIQKNIDANQGASIHPTSHTKIYWYYTMYQGLRPVNTLGQTHNIGARIVTFIDGKVVMIQGDGKQTLNCPKGQVRLGDRMNEVSQKCGLPQRQATGQPLQSHMPIYQQSLQGQRQQLKSLSTLSHPPSSPSNTKLQVLGQHTETVLIYKPNTYSPKMALVFIDNHLATSGKVITG